MALGCNVVMDATNQSFRATFTDEQEDDIFESGHGLARAGVKYINEYEFQVCWVEVYDRNKATLILDWIEMAVDQALGGADDYWKPSREIVPVVRSLPAEGDGV